MDSFPPKEKAIMEVVLNGWSSIDSTRLFFTTPDEVRAFLKLNEFDLSRQRDCDRLMAVHNEAVGYLTRELNLQLPSDLLRPENVADFFLLASRPSDPTLQKQACSLLKTMNIINHIDGRELLYNCPISLRDLFSLVEDKIERALSAISRTDSILLKYQGGRKPKESLITKLLCKKETIAAQIYDRVRYRIVTRKKEDIVKVILYLFSMILPFNYLIPEASVNQLIAVDSGSKLRRIAQAVRMRRPAEREEYSGRNYKVCKFVVDIPIRMENFLASSGSHFYREGLGTIVYVLVEFQIVDEETDRSNNAGESSHENYKKRQKQGVITRLMGS